MIDLPLLLAFAAAASLLTVTPGVDTAIVLRTATLEGRKTFLEAVRRTVERISIPLTVGGGISSVDDINKLLETGVSKISVNSAAVPLAAWPALLTSTSTRP